MSVVVIESKKWYPAAKQLVKNYDFSLVSVLDNEYSDATKNCQFCGQHLRYVAVIEGTAKGAPSHLPITQQIGCDCLERVLGTTWKHYSQAMSQYKTLVEAAKVESRKEKNKEKYADHIKWLEETVPLVKERFLNDMLRILTTGDKVFSPKMEKYLLYYMNNPKYNGLKMVQNLSKVPSQKEVTKGLLDKIVEVDGNRIHESMSAYGFVLNVLNRIEHQNGLTPKQMEALNKVKARYDKMNAVVVDTDPNHIKADMTDANVPW